MIPAHPFINNDEPFAQRVMDALRIQIDNGLVAVVATRSRMSEQALINWVNDVSLLFSYHELCDLAEALGVEEEKRCGICCRPYDDCTCVKENRR